MAWLHLCHKYNTNDQKNKETHKNNNNNTNEMNLQNQIKFHCTNNVTMREKQESMVQSGSSYMHSIQTYARHNINIPDFIIEHQINVNY